MTPLANCHTHPKSALHTTKHCQLAIPFPAAISFPACHRTHCSSDWWALFFISSGAHPSGAANCTFDSFRKHRQTCTYTASTDTLQWLNNLLPGIMVASRHPTVASLPGERMSWLDCFFLVSSSFLQLVLLLPQWSLYLWEMGSHSGTWKWATRYER